jgi:signal peptidase I
MVGGKYLVLVALLISVFITGLTIGISAKETTSIEKNMPSYTISSNSSISNFIHLPEKKESPQDRLKENDIKIYRDRVMIDVNNAILARFTDTKSMEPVLNKDTNAIEVIPNNINDVQIGDIISYRSAFSEGIIIHRVVEKDIDDQGLYFRTKGDNLNYMDPEKIRFENIQRVVVAILY